MVSGIKKEIHNRKDQQVVNAWKKIDKEISKNSFLEICKNINLDKNSIPNLLEKVTAVVLKPKKSDGKLNGNRQYKVD